MNGLAVVILEEGSAAIMLPSILSFPGEASIRGW